MVTFVGLPLPTQTFLDLAAHLRVSGDARDPVEVAEFAIKSWLANNKGEPPPAHDGRGYQWKRLFLPEGSRIRMKYKDEWYFADVEGDAIMYQGRSVSPRELANCIAATSRNAWRDLWIRFPGELRWKPAGLHRLDAVKAERLEAQPVQSAQPAPPAAAIPAAPAAPPAQAGEPVHAGRRSGPADRRAAYIDD